MNLDATSARPEPGRPLLSWRRAFAALGPILALALITLLFAVIQKGDAFLTPYNWRTIAVQTVITGTAALGMAIVIVAGGIDLSVGSVAALAAVGAGLAIRDGHFGLEAALAIGVGVGILFGMANGLLVVGLRVIPFIATLGTMNIARGLAKRWAGNTMVYAYDPNDPAAMASVPEWFDSFLRADAGTFFAPGVWALLLLTAATAVVLRLTVLGRHWIALGSNEGASRLSGLPVRRLKVSAYAVCGLFAGLAGVMQFANNNAVGNPTSAVGLELQAIAAVVIGGGSLGGGRASILGALVGALIITVLKNGCVHAEIASETQDILIGAIIIAAVAVDRWRRPGA